MTAMDLATIVTQELIMGGVAEAVLSPGSRSSPFGFALVEAERRGEIRLHVRIDERVAGFTALGLAVGGQRPVVVVTTSGTAVTNLHPAVAEAFHAGRPLIVISADRPAYQIGSGANQTTDQKGVFAPTITAGFHLSSDDDHVAHWRSVTRRALAAATGVRNRQQGPVQLNVALTPPLVPGPADLSPPPVPAFQIAAVTPAEPTRLKLGPRTVVLAGDGSSTVGAAAVELSELAGWPLLAEPSSNARVGANAVATYRLLLPRFAEQIERVICFGHPTLSRPVTELLSRSDLELIMVSPAADWIDPGLAVDQVVDAVSIEETGAVEQSDDHGWLDRWLAADRDLAGAVAQVIADSSVISGPALAATIWRALSHSESRQRGDRLVIGSSNPIRDLDLAPAVTDPPIVHANRGLAGIDGTLSTAAGISLAARVPVQVLVGDLTFLHDLNALLIGSTEPRPNLRIIVANDDGGSIFATLEPGSEEYSEDFERIFGTPHGSDLSALAAGFRADYRLVSDLGELADLVRTAPHGIQVIEVPVDRSQRRALDQRLRTAGDDVRPAFKRDPDQ